MPLDLTSTAEHHPARLRPAIFPIAWPVALLLIWAAAWFTAEDRGLVNSMLHAAVILTAIGWAGWLVVASGASRLTRWLGAFVLVSFLVAFYGQLLPFQTINNGDVGIVGVRWRWLMPDRQLDEATPGQGAPIPVDAWAPTPHDYPSFLGGRAWAEIRDLELASDWSNPPAKMWKQRIGAGWSGFAVVGDFAVTQEQRGDEELVVCYRVPTGEIVWSHADPVRFDPSGGGALGGVGPRATPTIHDGRVYTQGATGILNCFDAPTGKLVWSCDTLEQFGGTNLLWGKSGSPVVMGELVLIAVGDKAANLTATNSGKGTSLVAFDAATGKVAWHAGDRRTAYATPIVTELAGVKQIISINEEFVTAHDAVDGKVLWEHPWPGNSDANASTSQPIPVDGDRIFLSKGYGEGAELIHIVHDGDDWSVEPLWKAPVMKTKMSNVVIHEGHVFGLDDANLQCIELETGKQAWKKRRRPAFGHGQLLLADGKLLILSEEGEVILAEANQKKYVELGSFPAIEGVTWNTPALSGNRLLVRNAEWAACFELPTRDHLAPGQ